MGGLVAEPRGQRNHMGTEIAIALVVILVLTAIATFVWRVVDTRRSHRTIEAARNVEARS